MSDINQQTNDLTNATISNDSIAIKNNNVENQTNNIAALKPDFGLKYHTISNSLIMSYVLFIPLIYFLSLNLPDMVAWITGLIYISSIFLVLLENIKMIYIYSDKDFYIIDGAIEKWDTIKNIKRNSGKFIKSLELELTDKSDTQRSIVFLTSNDADEFERQYKLFSLKLNKNDKANIELV